MAKAKKSKPAADTFETVTLPLEVHRYMDRPMFLRTGLVEGTGETDDKKKFTFDISAAVNGPVIVQLTIDGRERVDYVLTPRALIGAVLEAESKR